MDLGTIGDGSSLLEYSHSILLEEDWLEQWKRDFKPLRVGKHLVVTPTWEDVQRGQGDRVIRIDPGQAFGTGHHETTRLCLEWLESWAETEGGGSSKSLLDVGTGSGILAIAAALLGFDRILALDNDPQAIHVARENLVLNGVTDRIELRAGDVDAVESRYEVVLANILALPLIEMAPLLAQRLECSGRLILSGILVEQSEAVQSAYEAQDLRLYNRVVAGEWCLMEFEKSEGR
jgi:ribosomal protein L11 methyltransferase